MSHAVSYCVLRRTVIAAAGCSSAALLQGDVKATGETQSSVQLELNNVFEEWVRAGSAALSVDAADQPAILPASTVLIPCILCNEGAEFCMNHNMWTSLPKCVLPVPAGYMTSEAHAEDDSPAAALDHTLNGSDDWTLVEDEEAAEALPFEA